MKLFVHLQPGYLNSVLTVGGRYVCGNAKSIMPAWADTSGGPLNYVQIKELIEFLRATSDREYEVRHPETNEEVRDASGKVQTFTGWRDPTSHLPRAQPRSRLLERAGRHADAGRLARRHSRSGATVLNLLASGIKFDKATLEAPADKLLRSPWTTRTRGSPQRDIYDASGKQVFSGDTINGVNTITYNVPALPPAPTSSSAWHPTWSGS